jgi:hypothetical protein
MEDDLKKMKTTSNFVDPTRNNTPYLNKKMEDDINKKWKKTKKMEDDLKTN